MNEYEKYRQYFSIQPKIDTYDATLVYNGPHPGFGDDKMALEISLAKWAIVAEETDGEDALGDNGWATCGLCMLYFHGSPICDGCPIAEDTRCRVCVGTPYVDWEEYGGADNARAEFEYLLGLYNRLYPELSEPKETQDA